MQLTSLASAGLDGWREPGCRQQRTNQPLRISVTLGCLELDCRRGLWISRALISSAHCLYRGLANCTKWSRIGQLLMWDHFFFPRTFNGESYHTKCVTTNGSSAQYLSVQRFCLLYQLLAWGNNTASAVNAPGWPLAKSQKEKKMKEPAWRSWSAYHGLVQSCKFLEEII